MTEAENLREREIEERAEALAEKRLRDPGYLARRLIALTEQLAVETRRADDHELQAKKYATFLDAEGFVPMAAVAGILDIPYTDPSGTQKTMGQNLLHSLFIKDGILIKEPGNGGYRLAHQHRHRGKMVTHTRTLRDGRFVMNRSVKFSAEGINYLIDKYAADGRVFYTQADPFQENVYRLEWNGET